PGAEQLFDILKEKRIPFTIATSAPAINVNFYVQQFHLDTWFDIDKIVFDDGTMPSKPAPDMYLLAAKKMGIPITECIIIEDSRSGIAAALNAKAGKIIGLGP